MLERGTNRASCTFIFLRADKVRGSSEEKLLPLQDIRRLHPEWLVRRELTFNDACTCALTRTMLSVSHRWENQAHPDPHGVQLSVIKRRLSALPDVELLWIDYSCMPQGQRSDAEQIEFQMMLPNINLIFLATQVLIIMDSSYFSRFWTLFEAWLSMQQVTSDGLLPASTAERYCIECVHTASAKFDGAKLKETWASKTPNEAYAVLSSNDVQVTNAADKEEQLPKLQKLNEFAVAQHAAWQGSAEAKMERREAEVKRREAEMKRQEEQREAEVKRREAEVKRREAEMKRQEEQREAEVNRREAEVQQLEAHFMRQATPGQKLFFTGSSQTASNGEKWTHGQQGEVMGPATGEMAKNGLAMRFPGNKGDVNCYLSTLSASAPPPLPGGHTLGQKLFFTGSSATASNGEKWTHGQQGEVMGPAAGETVKNGLVMRFPGNKGNVNCYLSTLSASAPPRKLE